MLSIHQFQSVFVYGFFALLYFVNGVRKGSQFFEFSNGIKIPFRIHQFSSFIVKPLSFQSTALGLHCPAVFVLNNRHENLSRLFVLTFIHKRNRILILELFFLKNNSFVAIINVFRRIFVFTKSFKFFNCLLILARFHKVNGIIVSIKYADLRNDNVIYEYSDSYNNADRSHNDGADLEPLFALDPCDSFSFKTFFSLLLKFFF